MYTDFYKTISQPFRNSHLASKALPLLSKSLVYATAIAFAGIALWLAVHADIRVVRYLIVCALSFILATMLRKKLNKPRPYQLYNIDPLIAKNTQGKSFPSRHVFSATVISCAFWWLSPVAGIIGFLVVALLAAIRVVGGVHFPKDVIAGIAMGVLCGLVGFWIA